MPQQMPEPTRTDPLAALEALADAGRAAEMASYHKAPRRYLGVAAPDVYAIADAWREGRSVAERVALANALWASDVHEARMAAARLLTQARIREDEALVWAAFLAWVPDFDAWALADHACKAGERRLVHDPVRLDTVEGWTQDPNLWVRRAALVVTLPWTKLTHPSAAQAAERERILGWAAGLVPDRDWFVQKAIGWWLRSLAKHDPARVRAFLAEHGPALRAVARKEATRALPPA
jgi:3-methyladenine DNA glycosylase AlkD